MKIKVFFLNSFFLLFSMAIQRPKFFSLDQFYANINGITSKLENYCQKLIFHSIFWLVLGNEDKIMICPFFKFSALEHFCGLKLISWVDILVVLIWYSFQSVRVDLGGELENWTKYSKITEYLKSMSPNFDSPYLWENSSPPLCVIHIQKRLDLLFHPVFPEFVLCCKNHTQIAL